LYDTKKAAVSAAALDPSLRQGDKNMVVRVTKVW